MQYECGVNVLVFICYSWHYIGMNRNPMRIMKNPAVFLAAALVVLSCASGPETIPNDLSPAELIQKAQEASDRNRYEVSLQYYETLIARFPFDIDNIIAAEYEIAFIHYKQKRYDIAKEGFTELLARYNTPDQELLPQQFKILSRKIMERIEEIENSANNSRPLFSGLLGQQNRA